jgi:hypothetical protein
MDAMARDVDEGVAAGAGGEEGAGAGALPRISNPSSVAIRQSSSYIRSETYPKV